LREENEGRWLPATVTWAESDGENAQFGVKLLAPHVRPGKAFCNANHDTHSTPCLLLFARRGPRPNSILLGPRCMPENTGISVDYGNHSLHMVLKHELSRTQGYIEYACEDTSEAELSPETVPLVDRFGASGNGPRIGDGEYEDDQRPWRRFLK